MDLACRVCFQEQELMVDIFEEVENFQSNLSQLLEKCGGLEVKREDNFSHYLCKDCTTDLLVAAKFREKCERAKIILEDATADNPSSIVFEMNNSMTQTIENPETFENNNEILNEFLLLKNDVPNRAEPLVTFVENVNDGYEDLENLNSGNLEEFFEIDDEAHLTEVPVNMELKEPTSINGKSEVILIEDDVEDLQTSEELMEDEFDQTVSLIPLKSNITVFENEKKLICDMCGAAFKYALNLKKHFATVHKPLKLFACALCDYCFSEESNLGMHLTDCKKKKDLDIPYKEGGEATDSPQSNNFCSFCGKKFPTFFALNMHLRTHTGERPFDCNLCDKAFKTHSALQLHLKRHLNNPELVCPTCGKTFYETNNLKAHLSIHTGEKPHICTICQKSFNRVFLLQNHMKTHTGERPFQCKYCGKSFIKASDRKMHELTHTGDRPFQCGVCQKGFFRRNLLNQHRIKYGHDPPQDQTETIGESQNHNDLTNKDQDILLDYNLDEYVAVI